MKSKLNKYITFELNEHDMEVCITPECIKGIAKCVEDLAIEQPSISEANIDTLKKEIKRLREHNIKLLGTPDTMPDYLKKEAKVVDLVWKLQDENKALKDRVTELEDEAVLQKLSELDPNWDSYDAEPITEAAIKATKDLLLILEIGRKPDFILPLSDGGIQLEWSDKYSDSVIEVEVSPLGELTRP